MKPFVALALLLLAACTQPYQRATIEERDAKPADFNGLRSLASATTPGRVLWVHGMCRHGLSWVNDRTGKLAAALGAPKPTDFTDGSIPGSAWWKDVSFKTPDSKSLDATFFVWSNLTEEYRGVLSEDASTGDTRASLNDMLKTTLMNTCLLDAVVYVGANGNKIRRAMVSALCRALDGVPSDTKGCAFPKVPSRRPIAFVTESLGSKVLFDAIREVWDAAKSSSDKERLVREFSKVSLIFMGANQIPLLDQASLEPRKGKSEETTSVVAEILKESRWLVRAEGALPPLVMVAFSDPNDLLSYRLNPTLSTPTDTRIVNVTVSNDWTYLGLVERPDSAHCLYLRNPTVIDIIANGYQGGPLLYQGPMPMEIGNPCF